MSQQRDHVDDGNTTGGKEVHNVGATLGESPTSATKDTPTGSNILRGLAPALRVDN